MSVINKMLRDLDQRAHAADKATDHAPPALSVVHGTASVASLPAVGKRRGKVRLVPIAGLLLCLAAAAWWWGGTAGKPPAPAAEPVGQVVVPLALPPAGMPALSVQGLDGALASLAQPEPAAPLAVNQIASAAPAVPPVSLASPTSSMPADVAAAPGARAPLMPRPDSPARPAPLPVAGPVADTPAAAGDTAVPAAQWQDAAMQTVVQAQRLWSAGSRDAAASLLTEAMLTLERFRAAELAGAGSAVALAMLRELVRMELALGQPDAVLALLNRNERLLSGQADLWAIRGSAAQRAGQHMEACTYYRTALGIRSGEPRWMLGAAVSHAALGQLAAAAELAEQARSLGAVSPDVLAYLRQLGVPLRER